MQWAAPGLPFDSSRAAAAREQSSRYGQWLRYGLVGNAATALFWYGAIGMVLGDLHDRWITTSSDGNVHLSGWIVSLQFLSMPLSLVAFAYLALLIAWIYQVGQFAEAMRWPATRNRVLGAFSILIPIVNLWWPYEAIRDAYPPGTNHGAALRWWLSNLIIPFVTSAVVIVVALVGSTTTLWITIAIAVVPLSVPVILGWKLIDDLDRAQRALQL